MKIKIIIEDVDVTVAQLLGLLGDNATVEIEQPQVKEVVEKTVEVVQPKKTEASKEVKKSKKYTCKYCGKNFKYKKSHKKCQTRCKAKLELKTKQAKKNTKSTTKKAEPAFKCRQCGVTESPEWRNKSADFGPLCNACGIRRIRSKRKEEKVKSSKTKSEPKFTRPAPKLQKPKKSKPKYERLSDDDLKEMVASFLLGNANTIVTSSQITATYVSSVKSKYEMTTAATQELSKIESRVVSVMRAAAKIIGINHCMAMDLEPNGLQIAVFDKVGITVAKLKKQL